MVEAQRGRGLLALFHGTASKEVTVRLVSLPHWYIMTISNIH